MITSATDLDKRGHTYVIRYVHRRWFRLFDGPGLGPGTSEFFNEVTSEPQYNRYPAVLHPPADAPSCKHFEQIEGDLRFGPFVLRDKDGTVHFGDVAFGPDDPVDVDSPVGCLARESGSAFLAAKLPKGDRKCLFDEPWCQGNRALWFKWHEGKWYFLEFVYGRLPRSVKVKPNTIGTLTFGQESGRTIKRNIWFGPLIRRPKIWWDLRCVLTSTLCGGLFAFGFAAGFSAAVGLILLLVR